MNNRSDESNGETTRNPRSSRKFSPHAFLKSRHPERFSDTTRTDEPSLDRSLLEFHLHTLTTRSQEKDFETFARRLGQKEICPNLLPQTGPTGGGDSKVDSETYPVSDELAFAWHAGTGRQASKERWAFAFSAKQDWRPKVRSDVEKIQRTERGYAKAFFVTNQPVPDRVRAEVEDELTRLHGLDVRILDQTWILDKVFENRHEALAIESLRLQASIRTVARKGPRDLQRERDLEDVERRIKAVAEEGRFDRRFVDDCLEAAELARDLELPRHEVDGRFARAERAAEEHGSSHQKLLYAYSRAWTSYWWHEDRRAFQREYLVLERLAGGTENAYELELLHNAWNVLHSLAARNEVEDPELELDVRTDFLAAELERLASEVSRPSTSLQSHTLRLLMRLVTSMRSNEDLVPVFRGLQEVIRESRKLVGFPLEPLLEVLSELEGYLGRRAGFQELHDEVVAVAGERSGELTAARLLLDRGAKQLGDDRPTDAIRSLGRALTRLHKHESRHDLVTALYLCGVAYERIGLPWAARGTLASAASIATNDFWSYEEITRHQVACCNQLKWLELRMGRLPHLLAWHELDRMLRIASKEKGFLSPSYAESEMNFDAILGVLLLRADLWTLSRLVKLPNSLVTLELPFSSIALRYALGDENAPVDQLNDPEVKTNPTKFFMGWRDQPAGERLTSDVQLYDGRYATLASSVLGCCITAECENVPACVAFAESILGALESLLATGAADHFTAREPTLRISVRRSHFTREPFSWVVDDADGRILLEVRCGDFDWTDASVEAVAGVNAKLQDLVVEILAKVFLVGDVRSALTKLFRDDRALERSILFGTGYPAVANVLGGTSGLVLSAWLASEGGGHPLKRSEAWDAKLPRPVKTDVAVAPGAARGMLEEGRLPHSQMKIASIVRVRLWEKAGWTGTGFWSRAGDASPPIIAPIFENPQAAAQIFRLWSEELGQIDHEDQIRLTILRGVDKKQPLTYRMIFAAQPGSRSASPGKGIVSMLNRMLTTTPKSLENLDRFEEHHRLHGLFNLAYAVISRGEGRIDLVEADSITKRRIFIRHAWEIGPNDIDSCGLIPGDDPIIPHGVVDAPVLGLAERLAGRSTTIQRPRPPEPEFTRSASRPSPKGRRKGKRRP